MRKVGFERQGNATYLVYELGPEDAVDSMGLGMLMNNSRIPGFAPTVFMQMDNIKQVKCDVTGRVPADQYLLGMVNKKRLLGVFRGIIQAYLSAEDYMIDANTIQLELGSIFADVASGETVMVCVPVMIDDATGADLRSFLKNILFSAQYDERENRDYVAQIMSYLNGSPTFSIHEFKELLDYVSIAPTPVNQTPPVMDGQYGGYAVSHIPQNTPAPSPPKGPPLPKNKPAEPPAEEQAETESEEDKISLFYLLQHYNKENAALYKQQKERKKSAKEAKKAGKKADKKETDSKASSRTFAVPGQENPLGGSEIPSEETAQKAEPARQTSETCQTPVQTSAQQGPAQSTPYQPLVQSTPYQPPVQSAPYQPLVQSTPYQPPVQSAPYQPPVQSTPYQPPVQPVPYQTQAQASVQSAPVETGKDETVYFRRDTGDETIFMGQEARQCRLTPQLIRKRNGEKILLDKPVFRLGRDADFNDYAIVENRYIGHGHCHLLCRNGEYFVVDDNSKNLTLVNGEPIVPGEEVKIAHGDVICLADEEFEFKLF